MDNMNFSDKFIFYGIKAFIGLLVLIATSAILFVIWKFKVVQVVLLCVISLLSLLGVFGGSVDFYNAVKRSFIEKDKDEAKQILMICFPTLFASLIGLWCLEGNGCEVISGITSSVFAFTVKEQVFFSFMVFMIFMIFMIFMSVAFARLGARASQGCEKHKRDLIFFTFSTAFGLVFYCASSVSNTPGKLADIPIALGMLLGYFTPIFEFAEDWISFMLANWQYFMPAFLIHGVSIVYTRIVAKREKRHVEENERQIEAMWKKIGHFYDCFSVDIVSLKEKLEKYDPDSKLKDTEMFCKDLDDIEQELESHSKQIDSIVSGSRSVNSRLDNVEKYVSNLQESASSDDDSKDSREQLRVLEGKTVAAIEAIDKRVSAIEKGDSSPLSSEGLIAATVEAVEENNRIQVLMSKLKEFLPSKEVGRYCLIMGKSREEYWDNILEYLKSSESGKWRRVDDIIGVLSDKDDSLEMKYTINHSCSHWTLELFYGKQKEACYTCKLSKTPHDLEIFPGITILFKADSDKIIRPELDNLYLGTFFRLKSTQVKMLRVKKKEGAIGNWIIDKFVDIDNYSNRSIEGKIKIRTNKDNKKEFVVFSKDYSYPWANFELIFVLEEDEDFQTVKISNNRSISFVCMTEGIDSGIYIVENKKITKTFKA